MSHLYAASSNDWKGRRYHGFGLNIQFPTLWENGLHNREWKCVLIQNLLPPTPLSYPSFPPRAIQFNSSWFYSAKLVLHATSNDLHSLSYALFILASLLSPQRVTFLSQAFFFSYSPFVSFYPSSSSQPIFHFTSCPFPSSHTLPLCLVSMETPHMSPTAGAPFSSYKLHVLPTVACGIHWNETHNVNNR